jgi:hypothetical protein
MAELEQLSSTLQKTYAAAADANLWEEALVAIEGFTGSAGAVLEGRAVEGKALKIGQGAGVAGVGIS